MESPSDPGAYLLQRGNYKLATKCKNDVTRVRASISGMEGLSPIGIEIYFDHLDPNGNPDSSAYSNARPGKMFCTSSTERGKKVCQSYGGEERSSSSYWMN